MRTHLGCLGQVELGRVSSTTRQKLDRVAASWLEFDSGSAVLEVRHVQPDYRPALREIVGELIGFLSELSNEERRHVPGGELYCHDEVKGQYVRIKVWEGGGLSLAWAQPDYTHAAWEQYRSQPIPIVPEPFQRLNGRFSLEAVATAADDIRDILDRTAGLYSEGDFEIVARIDRIEVALRNVNSSAVPLVYALMVLARPGSLEGEIDVSSFRFGDLGEYCRFVFGGGEIRLLRPDLWGDLTLSQTQSPPAGDRAA